MDEPLPPDQKLAAIIACCRKRLDRATVKLAAATAEAADARDALEGWERALTQWKLDNPDPQGSIFEKADNDV